MKTDVYTIKNPHESQSMQSSEPETGSTTSTKLIQVIPTETANISETNKKQSGSHLTAECVADLIKVGVFSHILTTHRNTHRKTYRKSPAGTQFVVATWIVSNCKFGDEKCP